MWGYIIAGVVILGNLVFFFSRRRKNLYSTGKYGKYYGRKGYCLCSRYDFHGR